MSDALHADSFTAADINRVTWPESWHVEVIDGELVVMKAPGFEHQSVILNIATRLNAWTDPRMGRVNWGIGLVYDDQRDDVIPDVVWISNERLTSLDEAGHVRNNCPELVVEVTSPGRANARRDRDKVGVYERRGALEYWIVDPQQRTVDQYLRTAPTEPFTLHTLRGDDWLACSVLDGCSCRIADFWT
jgi:Uma2 family endonuclease